RAPVLLSLLRNVRYTIAGNLLAGVLVGISTALLRSAFVQPLDTMLLAATMVVGSLPGAYGGAILARRTPSKWLKGLLAGILAITALRLLLFESPTPGSFAFGPEQALLGLGVGLGIGLISGLLGVGDAPGLELPGPRTLGPLPQDEHGTLRQLDDPVFDRAEGELPQSSGGGRADHEQGSLRALAERLRLPLGRVDDLRLDPHPPFVCAALEPRTLLLQPLRLGWVARERDDFDDRMVFGGEDQREVVDPLETPNRTREDHN